jgi:hypothetical protein
MTQRELKSTPLKKHFRRQRWRRLCRIIETLRLSQTGNPVRQFLRRHIHDIEGLSAVS